MAFLLTPPPEPRSGRSFRRPPLDGSLTIPEIYDWHWNHNPNHPIFVYPKDQRLHRITFAKLVPAAHRAGRLVAETLGLSFHDDSSNFPVVAIVATSGKLTVTLSVILCGNRRSVFRYNHLLHYHSRLDEGGYPRVPNLPA